MSKHARISKDVLYELRNKIAVQNFMAEALGIPVKYSEGYYRFQCPICKEMRTAVNERTNLGRCFRCNQNFNPIDITIEVRQCSFLEAVEEVQRYLNR